MNKLQVIYDFDSPLYGASTVLEERYIEVEHLPSGRIKEFKNITEFKGMGSVNYGGWLKKHSQYKLEDFNIEQKARRNQIPFSKAKEYLISSAESVREKEWCESIKYVISGDDNYRLKISDIYKDNRPSKPIMYKKLREWFIKQYGDEVITSDGCEADDVLSIFGLWGYSKATESGNYEDDDVCLVFIDKDLMQIPGWYWNYKSKVEKPQWQTEFKAGKSFWKQMMWGDVGDNIKGLEGVGEKKALTYLSECTTIQEMEDVVIDLYKQFHPEDWQDKFQLAYQLLKLQDKKGIIPRYEF